jgi:flavodoxin
MNNNKKSIIAYFSRRGYNYVKGNIIDLKAGNTEIVANKIQKLTGSDIFRIDTVKSYPTDYTETTKVAQRELHENARPELTDSIDNMEQYDIIVLGYPNWWGTMPMAVHNFLESYSFAGKTIIPFCTHEGSGMGHSIDDIKRLCPDTDVQNGTPIRGSQAKDADREVQKIIKLMEE